MASTHRLLPLFTGQQIAQRISELAQEIKRDYHDRCPLLLGILKGSFVFLADLARQLDFPVEMDFIRVASYGDSRETSGQVKLVSEPLAAIKDRHIIVVDDIVDTGLTTDFVGGWLKTKGPASVRLCALLDKPTRRRRAIEVDYRGFLVPNQFLVGYGLDLNEKYRNLPGISVINGTGTSRGD